MSTSHHPRTITVDLIGINAIYHHGEKLTCIVCVFPLLVTPYAKTVPAIKRAYYSVKLTRAVTYTILN